jgi:hypothetical protein
LAALPTTTRSVTTCRRRRTTRTTSVLWGWRCRFELVAEEDDQELGEHGHQRLPHARQPVWSHVDGVSACAAREGDQSPRELLSNTRQPRCWIRSRGLLISTSHAGMGRIENREHSRKCCQTVVQRSSLHGLHECMLYARALHAMSTRNRFIHLQRHTNLNALPRQRQRRGRSDHRQDKPRLSGFAAKRRGGDPEVSTSLHSYSS